MAAKNDGGPAFPRAMSQDLDDYCKGQNGMSLRDYFAGQALIAFMSCSEWAQGLDLATANNPGTQFKDNLASNCYVMADALIYYRSKDGG